MSARGPRVGVRVLDLARVMAGPTCGRMLADMDAAVVKIERAGGGDTRRMLPPDIAGEAAAFMMMNRNKRGIVLGLKKSAARDVLKWLAASADVLPENYRHDTLAKLGLGYEAVDPAARCRHAAPQAEATPRPRRGGGRAGTSGRAGRPL